MLKYRKKDSKSDGDQSTMHRSRSQPENINFTVNQQSLDYLPDKTSMSYHPIAQRSASKRRTNNRPKSGMFSKIFSSVVSNDQNRDKRVNKKKQTSVKLRVSDWSKKTDPLHRKNLNQNDKRQIFEDSKIKRHSMTSFGHFGLSEGPENCKLTGFKLNVAKFPNNFNKQNKSVKPTGRLGEVSKSETIVLHTDFKNSGDLFPVKVEALYESKSKEVIKKLLKKLSIIDDVNLYKIKEVTYPITTCIINERRRSMMPLSRDLLNDESPVDTYMKSLRSSGETKWCQRRLEVEKIRSKESIIVKFVCRVKGHEVRAKHVQFSLKSRDVSHILKLVLRKFRFDKKYDVTMAEDFVMCEILHDGILKDITEEKNHSWNSSISILLCEKNSLQSQKEIGHYFLDEFTRRWLKPMGISEKVSTLKSYSTNTTYLSNLSEDNKLINQNLEEEIEELKKDNKSLKSEVVKLRSTVEAFNEQMKELRSTLEEGLDEYSHNLCLHLEPPKNISLIENTLRSLEEDIRYKEKSLAKLFVMQRKLTSPHTLALRKSSLPLMAQSISKVDVSITSDEEKKLQKLNSGIALHQAQLLIVKHQRHTQNMRLAVYASNTKCEAMRKQLIDKSLFRMLTGHSELDDAASHLVVTCKTDCRELKLRQVNTALGIRKFVDEDYNGLIKGDEIIEFDGSNQFSSFENFTKTLVVLRQKSLLFNPISKSRDDMCSDTSSGVADVNNDYDSLGS